MKNLKKKLRSGFTLIELFFVLGFGVIAAGVIVGMIILIKVL